MYRIFVIASLCAPAIISAKGKQAPRSAVKGRERLPPAIGV
jgi:hypothetical protein